MTINRHTMGEAKLLYANSKEIVPAHEYDALAAELAEWKRMRNEAMAVAVSNRTRIDELTAELAEIKLQRDSWKRIAESGLGLTAETPDDAWLCVCGLTVKKRYQCLCGGSEDNSRADRFTVTGNETLTAEEFGTADDTEGKS